MSTARRFTRRRVHRSAAVTLAGAATLALLAGCGGASSDSATSVGDAVPGGKSGTTAIPTQDVVSSVKTDPGLSARLPADVRDSGSLSLGTSLAPGVAGLPHAGSDSKGKDVGLDVDLRNAVAKVLGIKWEVLHGTFATIIPGVQNGKYDVGADNFGVTESREKVVDFATYLNDGQSFLGSKEVEIDKATKLTDLCGLTVATSPGSTFQQILTDGASKCSGVGKKPYKVLYFSDSAPIFLGLANGKVDIYFGPTLALKYDATHVPGTKYLGEISTTPVGFVTKKGSPLSPVLSDAVNKLIADGDYAKIFKKWGVPGTGTAKSQVNPPPTF
ncbi:ABC transporter substrate-binding protein [Streptomyces sp. 150FB]|uniref:transporter substrate-binding domain-containing protein n=1 Tax=Streptomyces sp. 150FB TaxID=1576605 RepID=UPI000589682C|nr:transporter substrate-binding domain-containing protein [Streptomyces sp. 150FB]KIF73052.1 ABC transporter substrate-binding protein [Streptomyces sp. 150FB]